MDSDRESDPKSPQPMDVDPLGTPSQNPANSPEQGGSGQSTSGSRNTETSSEASDTYLDIPKAPYKNGCRVVINEVCTRNTINDYSFIEHQRVCPRGVQQVRTD